MQAHICKKLAITATIILIASGINFPANKAHSYELEPQIAHCAPMGQGINSTPTLLSFNQQTVELSNLNNSGFELYCGARIPSHLLLPGYTNRVNLSLFKHKVSGKFVRYREERKKYMIDKDKDGHKGSCWKLLNRNGVRIASISCKGDIVGR